MGLYPSCLGRATVWEPETPSGDVGVRSCVGVGRPTKGRKGFLGTVDLAVQSRLKTLDCRDSPTCPGTMSVPEGSCSPVTADEESYGSNLHVSPRVAKGPTKSRDKILPVVVTSEDKTCCDVRVLNFKSRFALSLHFKRIPQDPGRRAIGSAFFTVESFTRLQFCSGHTFGALPSRHDQNK